MAKSERRYCFKCQQAIDTTLSSCPQDSTQLVDFVDASTTERLRQYKITGHHVRNQQDTEYPGEDADGKSIRIKIFQKQGWPPSAQELFNRELEASQTLRHKHIGRFLEMGGGNFPYVIYEYNGESLRDILRKEGALPPSKCHRIIAPVVEALAQAHSKNVLHRNLRPENILQQSDECIKLVGFNFASPNYAQQAPGTCTRIINIDPIYSSPEELQMVPIVPASDVYSLAVVLYETLTGMPPFQGSSAADTAMKHMKDPPPPFSSSCPSLDLFLHLQTVIFKALEKDPQNRYQSMSDFGKALEAAIDSSQVPADTKPIAVGMLIDEKYEITAHIDSGGMGSVFKAHDKVLDREVVVKALLPTLLGDREDRARFKREGRVLADIVHAGVVKFYSFGVWQNRFPYIVMEHLSGSSLRKIITNQEKLAVTNAIDIAIQVCEALEVVHERGIVHRDLKPTNIIVTEDGTAKLVDFGLARILSNSRISVTHHLTRTGLLVGSIHYMSPEQCLGQKVDHQADIYSLGCVIYEAVTGMMPLMADNPIGLLHKHVAEKPASLSATMTEPPPAGLETVLFNAMAKEADHRYQSMGEFKRDLELVRDGKGAHVGARTQSSKLPRKARRDEIDSEQNASATNMLWRSFYSLDFYQDVANDKSSNGVKYFFIPQLWIVCGCVPLCVPFIILLTDTPEGPARMAFLVTNLVLGFALNLATTCALAEWTWGYYKLVTDDVIHSSARSIDHNLICRLSAALMCPPSILIHTAAFVLIPTQLNESGMTLLLTLRISCLILAFIVGAWLLPRLLERFEFRGIGADRQ